MTGQQPSNERAILDIINAVIVANPGTAHAHRPSTLDDERDRKYRYARMVALETVKALQKQSGHEPRAELSHDATCWALGPDPAPPPGVGPLKLDTDRQVFFYEQDHYYLSNFSAFAIHWRGRPFFTSEHAYHWSRFDLPEGRGVLLQDCVQRVASAHEAFRFAQDNKSKQRDDWDAVKVDTMRDILRAKAEQHEYVRRKLLQTGDRELIENSWRDPYWGWGENRDGLNMLGKLWMEIRAELRASALTKGGE